jgi:hypothetical protein
VVPAPAADPKAAASVRAKPAATTAPNATDAPVIRYTGAVCGSPGSVEIEPFLWDVPSVVGDQPCADRQAAARSVVNREGNDRFKCLGVREGRGLAYPRAGLAAELNLEPHDKTREYAGGDGSVPPCAVNSRL